MDIAIIGYGVVGSGVSEVIRKNSQSIAARAGEQIRVKKILDIKDIAEGPDRELLTKDPEDVFGDPEIKVVVETIGGIRIAQEYTKRAFSVKKHVVTSNKELVATCGPELLQMAAENGVSYLFEASVGGGIPIIRPLNQCLAANEVYEIAGILNGTTNFVLTKMIREGLSFSDSLELAQRLGYAEHDPSADVGGQDACRKICILASLAFGKHVYPEQVHTEGIAAVTLDDVKFASAWGGVIKLIGRARKREDGHLDCIVSPMILPSSSQLADVNDVFNGILVRGDAIGDVVFYGRGAGKLPTASAVVADVIDEVKHLGARKYLSLEPGEKDYVADYQNIKISAMLRLRCSDIKAARQQLEELLGH
jgi:homoserine dehydrogenase